MIESQIKLDTKDPKSVWEGPHSMVHAHHGLSDKLCQKAMPDMDETPLHIGNFVFSISLCSYQSSELAFRLPE